MESESAQASSRLPNQRIVQEFRGGRRLHALQGTPFKIAAKGDHDKGERHRLHRTNAN
jgi:hypothetical protein